MGGNVTPSVTYAWSAELKSGGRLRAMLAVGLYQWDGLAYSGLANVRTASIDRLIGALSWSQEAKMAILTAMAHAVCRSHKRS
jgi:hypothetical protein